MSAGIAGPENRLMLPGRDGSPLPPLPFDAPSGNAGPAPAVRGFAFAGSPRYFPIGDCASPARPMAGGAATGSHPQRQSASALGSTPVQTDIDELQTMKYNPFMPALFSRILRHNE